MSVSMQGLLGFCQKQVVLRLEYVSIDPLDQRGSVQSIGTVGRGRVFMSDSGKGGNDSRRASGVELEGCEASRRIDGVHVVETHKWQCANPTCLIAGNMIPKQLDDGTIGAFACAISLRVERCGHFEFYTREQV